MIPFGFPHCKGFFCVILGWVGFSGSLHADIQAPAPDPTRLEVSVLAQGMPQPLTMAVLPDGRVLWVELKGKARIYHPADGRITEAADFKVYDQQESGLLGVVLDPGFATNHWLYLKYSHPDTAEEWISRFTLQGDVIDRDSETLIIKFPTDRKKDNFCHEAGSLAFGPDGCLYISAGDNTNPFGDSKGYAPIDERPDRDPFDAQRTSGNTADVRGGILRVRPLPEGGYAIPEGNLFPDNGKIRGAPEVYVMGCRNPWRISVDPKSGFL